MHDQPTDEHRWLRQLLGEWICEVEANMGPDQPPMQRTGSETVRSLGQLWTIGEWTMEGLPEPDYHVMTLGYDPSLGKFVGTFTSSAMARLWVYQGTLDAGRRVLTLEADGPSFAGDGSTALYHDVIEFVDADHRTLTSRCQMPDGTWQQFMQAHYRRRT